jgi:hypothetical protein
MCQLKSIFVTYITYICPLIFNLLQMVQGNASSVSLYMPKNVIFLFFVGWDWVHLVLRLLLAHCTSPRWKKLVIVEQLVEWRLAGDRSTKRKPAPAPLRLPQIAHKQTRARTRAAAVGNQRQTAWAIVRPASSRIRTYDPSIRSSEDSSCLRMSGHCDRMSFIVRSKLPDFTNVHSRRQ